MIAWFGSLAVAAAGHLYTYLRNLGRSRMYRYLLKTGEAVYSQTILTNRTDLDMMAFGPEEVLIGQDIHDKLSHFATGFIFVLLIYGFYMRFTRNARYPIWLRVWNFLLGRPAPEGSYGPIHVADGSPEFYELLAERLVREYYENPDNRH